MKRRFIVSSDARAEKQFQGSKKKARKAAYLERKARKESERNKWDRLHSPDCGIEEMATIFGIKLQ